MTRIPLLVAMGSLALALFASSAVAAGPSATLVYRGLDADIVGTVYNAHADGEKDGHFTVTLDTGGQPETVTLIELSTNDGGYWDTVPQGSWAVLGVIRGGKRLNPEDQNLSDAVSGKVTYEIYGGNYGYFQASHSFVVKIGFADGTSILSPRVNAAPGLESAAPKTTTTTATTPAKTVKPASNGPNTHQAIPDFWVSLSARVITHNTLGLGSDLALTAGATNNQVLSVTVFERATGCAIQGADVELRDPSGALVPGTHFQTREGLIDMGGLRLRTAGTYHLWVYAKDSGGNVVMQSYLPIQVKDRKGQAFTTLNGRPFTYGAGEWSEGKRLTSSAFRTAAMTDNPFTAFVTAFQTLVTGIRNSILGAPQQTKGQQAATILKDPKATPQFKLQKVQSQTGMVPEFLVTGPGQPAEARAVDVSKARVKLIGNDGAGLIGNDGASLIGNDGASLIGNDGGGLITNDGGSFVVSGGNIISSSAAGAVSHRTMQAAYATSTGACSRGYKTVGAGKTQTVNGSPVLADSNGKISPGTFVIGGKNEMPVNALAK